jgi:hypothetical protein
LWGLDVEEIVAGQVLARNRIFAMLCDVGFDQSLLKYRSYRMSARRIGNQTALNSPLLVEATGT